MFGSNHKNHKFEHLAKVYDQHLKEIKDEQKLIAMKLQDYSKLMDIVRKSIDSTQKAKDDKEEELVRVMSLFKEKLELQLNDKLMILLSEKSAIGEEIGRLESLEKNLDKEITASSKSELIEKSKELISSIAEMKSRPVLPLSEVEVTPHFPYATFINS